MKKVFIVLTAVLLVLLTAFATYRIIMHNVQIEVSDGSAYLAVFGQTDFYSLDK